MKDENSSDVLKEYAAGAIYSIVIDNCKFSLKWSLKSPWNFLSNEYLYDFFHQNYFPAHFYILASNKKIIGYIGGIDAVVPLLASKSDKVKINAAKTIWAICEVSSGIFLLFFLAIILFFNYYFL